MKLKFEQIKNITQGAEIITKENGTVKFFRFNEEEQRLYLATEFYSKTFSTAGVRMEFRTDGDTLCLKIKTAVASSRTYFSLDVLVNEKYIGSIRNFEEDTNDGDYTQKQFPLGRFSKKFSVQKGKKKVIIIFPWSVITELEEIEIKNCTYVIPVKKENKVVIYGDSITNGYDALYSYKTYANQVGNILNAEIYNKAIGGEVFFPALVKVSTTFKPNYIVVAYGTNNWGTGELQDFKVKCAEFYSEIANHYSESTVFAITPIWRADHKEERKFGDFDDVGKYIEKVCSEYKNIKVISGFELVPHDKRFFADFRLHPNDKGFEYYTKNLKRELKKG